MGVPAGLAVLVAVAAVAGEGELKSRTDAIAATAFLPAARGMESVAAIANAGDPRVFLALRTGRIVVFDRTRVLPGAFLDISSRVSCCGERGMLSLAFHPQYSGNGFVFVSYTDPEGRLVVARYRRAAKDSGKLDPATGVSLLTIPFPENASRYGGALAFGRDGYLYVGVGDGGSPNDTPCTAQRADSLLGKILRLDVNVNTTREPYYGIPLSNPFSRSGGALEKVWAKGLRDPRRLSFDRATGDLYITDTGETRQEIDLQPAMSRGGENYGWPMLEGSVCTQRRVAGCPATLPACESADLKLPILEYSAETGDCSELVGGVLYRGARFPALAGVYLYGDYCTGQVWGTGQLSRSTLRAVTALGEDAGGEIYAGTDSGGLFRMDLPPPTPTPLPAMERVPPVENEETLPPREYSVPRARPREVPREAPPEPVEAPAPAEISVPTTTPVPTEPPVPTQTPLVVYVIMNPPINTPTPTATKTRVPTGTPTPTMTATPEIERSAPTRVPREQPPPRTVTPRS